METTTGNSFKALVVEDQQLFRDAVVDELTFYGFQASTANDGEEGLKAARASTFDVILSDMRMPNKDGKWFLSELRKTQKCAPPFIFMTGFTDLAPQDAFAMGADGFLGKPLDTDRLNAIISKVCKPVEIRWSVKPSDDPLQAFTNHGVSIEATEVKTGLMLGRGGMFLASEETPLRAGDLIEFLFTFDEGPMKRLEGMGRVVWKRSSALNTAPAGYGIDFEYLTPETMQSWLEHLKQEEIVAFVPKGGSPGL